MPKRSLTIDLLPATFAVALLPPGSSAPPWTKGAELISVTHTPTELSIVCEEARVPSSVQSQRGFRCLRVLGPLDFSEVGILASLASPLARTGISIFAISTYETDYLLVPEHNLEAAISALSSAGHAVRRVGAA
jgi:hypothetical protein